MDADAFPHCAQVREAWAVCAAAVEAHRRGLETDISSVLGCEDLARVHTARRQAQTLLSRELADGRARFLRDSVTDALRRAGIPLPFFIIPDRQREQFAWNRRCQYLNRIDWNLGVV